MDNDAQKQLKRLLIESGAFEAAKDYVAFDQVWHDPLLLTTCADLVYQHFVELVERHRENIPVDKSRLVLLVPDAIRSNFGIMPVGVLVASRFGCRFAIWKEMADISWGTSAIMGSELPDLHCIVLQDVVSRAHTAIRIAQSLKMRKWCFDMYVAVILNNKDEAEPALNNLKKIEQILGYKPEFDFMLSARHLG